MKKIGVDLGGTKIEIQLSNDDVLDIISKERVPTEKEKGYEYILNKVCDLIKKYLELAGGEATIGIGIPGSPSPKTSLVRNANTESLNGQNFAGDIEKVLGQKVYIANDANCLALSECIVGAGKGLDPVVGIILGTGVGSGVIINGKILVGANGNGGEFGHSTIVQEGIPCWCGKNGCVEKYLAGPGFENSYFEISGTRKTSAEIYADIQNEERYALEAKRVYLKHFKVAIGNLVQIIDPEAIILGGGVSNMDFLYDEGKKLIDTFISDPYNEFQLLKNKLGDSSGIFGAALLPEMHG